MGILKEFIDFAKMNKKYWILPVVIVLILFTALIILTESSVIAPFIYTLF